MKFSKMHGAGNDYIYISLFEEKVSNPRELAIRLSDRHFGIGGDGIVLIGPSDEGDFSMRMFNADGSESPMCGNAARCVGKYIYDKKLSDKKQLALSTKSGIKILELAIDEANDTVKSVCVNMGKASTHAADIPVKTALEEIINYPLPMDGKTYPITCVSVGNPHCVVFTKGIDELDLEKIGPLFENHPLFPERINTEFIEIINRNTLKMRVWERGSGETLACGTGACASVVAGVLNNLCEPQVTVKLRGGDLNIEWQQPENRVFLSGDAHFVFEGEILPSPSNR